MAFLSRNAINTRLTRLTLAEGDPLTDGLIAVDTRKSTTSAKTPRSGCGAAAAVRRLQYTFEVGKAYTLRATFTDGIDSAFSEIKLSKAQKTLNVHPTSKNIGLGQFAVPDLDADDVKRLDMTYRPYFHEGARDADGREIIGKTDYSTDEVDTGLKWVDGKPLYARVLVINTINSDVYISHITDIAETILFESATMWATAGGKRYCFPPYYNNSNDFWRVYMTFTDGEIRIHASTNLTNTTTYIRLLYTKAAD